MVGELVGYTVGDSLGATDREFVGFSVCQNVANVDGKLLGICVGNVDGGTLEI